MSRKPEIVANPKQASLFLLSTNVYLRIKIKSCLSQPTAK